MQVEGSTSLVMVKITSYVVSQSGRYGCQGTAESHGLKANVPPTLSVDSGCCSLRLLQSPRISLSRSQFVTLVSTPVATWARLSEFYPNPVTYAVPRFATTTMHRSVTCEIPTNKHNQDSSITVMC